MSERLSDEELSAIEQRSSLLIKANERAYVLPDALRAAERQCALVSELRERRAADLSDADREALANAMLYVTAWSERTESSIERGRCKLAMIVLSRLVERKP